MKRVKIFSWSVIVGISILGVLGLILSFIFNMPKDCLSFLSSIIGIIGTIASIILSIIAMIYANKSSEDAEHSLEEINKRYDALCKEIAANATQSNLGEKGIETILSHNNDK